MVYLSFGLFHHRPWTTKIHCLVLLRRHLSKVGRRHGQAQMFAYKMWGPLHFLGPIIVLNSP